MDSSSGASLAIVLHSFASGGAAVTGVEAISNGVPAFKKPEWKNARNTLVIMGALLGVMFLGLSIMDAKMHVAPFENGTPTVISQIGQLAYGSSLLGHVLYYCLQAGTMLILVLAANTSFADFPRLASFHAGDNFMPRQLTKRGHRLVFSNGIIFLAVAGIVVLIATDAKVDRLIPLYAIGVFTSFTLSQAGMAKHHIREKEKGWRWGLFINGTGAIMTLLVDVVIAIFKFTHGAWVIVVFVPIMVVFLVRLAKQYAREDEALVDEVPQAVAAPLRRRLVVMVFVDRLDLAVARAMQFGRALRPDELRAVHFVIDQDHADKLAEDWRAHGLATMGLELIDCPDRRLTRSAVTAVAHELDSGDAEVCVLLPERGGCNGCVATHPAITTTDCRVDVARDPAASARQCHDGAVPFRRARRRRARPDGAGSRGAHLRQRPWAALERRARGRAGSQRRAHHSDCRRTVASARARARPGAGRARRAHGRKPDDGVHAGGRDRWRVDRLLRTPPHRRRRDRRGSDGDRHGDRASRSVGDRQSGLRAALGADHIALVLGRDPPVTHARFGEDEPRTRGIVVELLP